MNKFVFPMLGPAVFCAGLATYAGRMQQPPSPVTHPTIPPYVTDTIAADALNSVIEQYCQRCHGERRQQGNLTLQNFDVSVSEQTAEVAERMIRKLRVGMMPPAGARRPSEDTLMALVTALETRIDESAAINPNPGSRAFQRLNQAEYAASIRDLLGLEVDVSVFLPLDTKSHNFDNIADAQMPSTTLMEGYFRAASHISRTALGDHEAGPTSTSYKVPRTASQKDRVEGAPYGTRGGISVMHNFPADGEYVFQVELHPAPEGELFGRTQVGEQVEVSIDGERAAILNIDRWMSESDPTGMRISTDSLHVRAGAHRITAAFIKRFEGPEDDLITPIDHTLADTQIGLSYGVTTLPHLRDLAIVGPFVVTGVSDSPSRRRIFSCRPTAADEARPCAQDIITRIASRAYRRPLNDTDVDGLMSFYEQGDEEGGFETGIRTALQAILSSPHFVFRIEEQPATLADNGLYEISDIDLASRLSFFLWGLPPDEELLGLASANGLSDVEILEGQVRRMLEDPRSRALSTRFAAQWLRLQDLEKVHPDALSYPYFDYTLAASMQRETELFFDHLVREDRSLLEFLTADYTFVNERLARHYGIPNVTGPEFQRVSYPNEHRRGILGHGSVLTLTSHGDRTSPVLRGKWVMEVLLGSPPPPPPPNVPDLEATADSDEGRLLTVRERLEEHRSNPACRSCHQMMDPIGLALENFDVTGAYRIKDNGVAINVEGELYDGTPLGGPADLRQAMLNRPEPFIRNFIENLMAYGLGRRVEYYDMPTVREVAGEAAANNHRLSSYIVGIVKSPAFRMGQADPTLATGEAQQ
jgi:hypothetical protein